MPAQRLSVHADDPRQFFLRIEGDTIVFGADPNSPDGAIPGVRVTAIHCELEVAGEQVAVRTGASNGDAGQPLTANEERRVGSARLRLHASAATPPGAATVAPKSGNGEPANVPFRLFVVDGADAKRTFALSPAGVTRIGRNAGSPIRLNDLLVAPQHCQVEVVGTHVFVTPESNSTATSINQKKIDGKTEVHVGNILRVGNSHLRLEFVDDDVSGSGVDLGATLAPAPPANDSWSSEEPEHHGRKRPGAPALSLTPVSTPILAPTPPRPTPPREPSPFEKIRRLSNSKLGHFQLGNSLGEGHAGVVFRARDLKTDHDVALKVLSPEFPKNDAEIQSLGRVFKVGLTLRDSHLVTLLAVGKSDQFTWIARELIEGESLEDHVAHAPDGRPGWKRACRIAAQIGAALDYLHQHKIVHGNLTPRNVLIREEDGSAKLADVLLAQALAGSHLDLKTRDHKRTAEAAYRSPEQLAKADARPDFRCDLYALGVLCYEVITGKPPFAGDSIEEVRELVSDGNIVRPSKKQKDIPLPFEAALLKLLARDPAARYHEVGEFLDVVEPILMMNNIP